MTIKYIEIKDLRNLQDVTLTFETGFNLFYGLNGSGKTSLLESLFILGHGRSFKERFIERIIRSSQTKLSIFAKLMGQSSTDILTVGIERDCHGKNRYRVGNEFVDNAAKLAELIPIKLINPDSYQLLEAGPQFRRQYLDWGMFHVEHSFYGLWKESQRILKQRNAILKDPRLNREELACWDVELDRVSSQLHELRGLYFQDLILVVERVLTELLPDFALNFHYYPGWSTQKGAFFDILQQSQSKDILYGYTNYGPHRADIKINIDGKPAHSILSRGQQKMLVNVLHLAQGLLLKEKYHKTCLYLIDDLPAELDKIHRKKVVNILQNLQAQVFVTGVEHDDLYEAFQDCTCRMFHVEHGRISCVQQQETQDSQVE